MFKIVLAELKDKVNEIFGNTSIKKFDINDFNDPVADKTGWLPLKPVGPRFYPYKLVKVSSTQYRYQYAIWGRIFIWVFGFIAALVFIGGLILLRKHGIAGSYIYFLTSFAIMLIPYFLNQYNNIYKVFDLALGCYWLGKKEPQFSGHQKKEHKIIYFNKLHALQILSERAEGRNKYGKHIYSRYEMNFVMKDGSRYNILYHENKHQVLADSQVLAKFLGIPVWNVSN